MTILTLARQLLDSLFSTVDTKFGLSAGTLVSYAVCTTTIFVLLLVLNLIWSEAQGRLRSALPSADARIDDHYQKTKERARRLAPESPTARSDIAAACQPPAGIGRLQFARVQRRLAPLDRDVLQRWAHRDVNADRYSAKIARVRFLLLGPRPSRGNLLSGRRTAAVLALATVLWVRPSHQLADWITARSQDMWRLIDGGTVTRTLPALMIIAGLFVVCSRTALDNMRARDEASKDANKLLAELLARLVTARRATRSWRQVLSRERFSLTDELVRRLTGHRYHALSTGGIALTTVSTKFPLGHPAAVRQGEADAIASAVAEVTEVCERIRQAGLQTVCRRLTWAEHAAFDSLGIFRIAAHEVRPLRSAPQPSHVRAEIDQILEFAQHQFPDPDDPEERARFGRWVEDQAFGLQKGLDERLAQLAAVERNLDIAIHLLNRRLHTTRALAAFGKS
ncbi:hypothetical protein [Nocardia asteroides]